MKAVVRRQGRVFLDPAAPAAAPLPGEAVVRPTRAGVTSSDAGSEFLPAEFEGVLGHECVGVVERVEPDPARPDSRKLERKRVLVSPASSCGVCERCRSGLWLHCESGSFRGLWRREGCLAERVCVPVKDLVELPAELDDDRALFAWMVGSAARLGHSVRIEGKTFVTVLGDGPLGLVTAQLLAARNASVRLLGRHEARFALCERWGVRHRHEAEAGRRADQDVVVDCTGSPQGLTLAAALVRPRGTIVVQGPPVPGPTMARPADLAPLLTGELTLLTSRGGNVREGLEALASGKADVLPLISRRVRLADAPAALEAVRARAVLRVVVE